MLTEVMASLAAHQADYYDVFLLALETVYSVDVRPLQLQVGEIKLFSVLHRSDLLAQIVYLCLIEADNADSLPDFLSCALLSDSLDKPEYHLLLQQVDGRGACPAPGLVNRCAVWQPVRVHPVCVMLRGDKRPVVLI